MATAMATRAGNVATLRAQDVKLDRRPEEGGKYGLGVTQRFGKGTTFRGTYGPASTLGKDNAKRPAATAEPMRAETKALP